MLRQLVALLCVSFALSAAALDTGIVEASLPAEARETLRLIDRGGPFPYPRDGITFHNRERRLPEQLSGYYREYTVPTPGSRDRGARRIITGAQPSAVFYYTADHYETFRRIQR
ncbi:MAG: ribonuclease domain-containing protein [Sulfuritalea sp.]|nr:ribonuclease domain-containing protein [Sulfuritalea sp.]